MSSCLKKTVHKFKYQKYSYNKRPQVLAAMSCPAPAPQQVSVILPISPPPVDTVGLQGQWVEY